MRLFLAGRKGSCLVLFLVLAVAALRGVTTSAASVSPTVPLTQVRAGDAVMLVDPRATGLLRAATSLSGEVEKAWAEAVRLWPDLASPDGIQVYLGLGPTSHLEETDGNVGTRAVVAWRTVSGLERNPRGRTILVAYVVAAAIHERNLKGLVPSAGDDVVAQGVGWFAALTAEGRDPGRGAAATRAISPPYPLATVLGGWRAIPSGAEQIASFFGFVGQQYGGDKLTLIRLSQPREWRQWPGFTDSGLKQILRVPDLNRAWNDSLPAPSPEALRDAATTVRRWRLWGLAATVGGVALVGGLLLLLAGPVWRRRGLAGMVGAYLGLSLFEYWYGTAYLNPYIKVTLAYAETALVAWTVLHLAARRRKANGGLDNAARAPRATNAAGASDAAVAAGAGEAVPTWLFVTGYFLLTMALRLPIYGEVREVWAKAPHLMLVLASVFLLERGDWASLGLSVRRFRSVIILVIAGFLIYRVADAAGNFLGVLALGGGIKGVYGSLGSLNPPSLALRFFYGNFVEEIFFRSYVQSRLERRLPFAAATAVQALLFGLYHVNYNMFPPDAAGIGLYVLFAAVFGVQMTLLYRSTGSLWVPVIAHPMANLGVMSVLFWGARGGQWQSDLGRLFGHTARLLVSLWLIPRLLTAIAKAVAPGGSADPGKVTMALLRGAAVSLRRSLRDRLVARRLQFSRAPLLDRLMTVFWVISVPFFVYLLVFSPVGGRPIMGVFLALIAVSLGLAAFARRRHRSTLKELADHLGLDYIETPEQEKGHPLLDNLKWHYVADVYRWKLAGHHPFAAGTYQGFPVVIRRPLAVDFDLAAADSTRIGVYVRPHIEGFVIYSSRHKPKGKRWVPTGDAAFDARFAVSAQFAGEVAAILDAGARRTLLALDRVGLTGIEVSRFGVLYYEPGLASEAETVGEILDALALLAGRAKAFGTE